LPHFFRKHQVVQQRTFDLLALDLLFDQFPKGVDVEAEPSPEEPTNREGIIFAPSPFLIPILLDVQEAQLAKRTFPTEPSRQLLDPNRRNEPEAVEGHPAFQIVPFGQGWILDPTVEADRMCQGQGKDLMVQLVIQPNSRRIEPRRRFKFP
jgi:hypothetical protein